MQLHYSLRADDDCVVFNIISQEKVDFKVSLSVVRGDKQTMAQVMTESSIGLSGNLIYLRGRSDHGMTKTFRYHTGESGRSVELVKNNSKYLDAYIRCNNRELKRGTVFVNEISRRGNVLINQ